jgi:hypothetical protein
LTGGVMRGPWAALTARRERRARLDKITEAMALAWAQAYRDEGRPVPPAFDPGGRADGVVVFLRPGARPSRPRHRRPRRGAVPRA